MRFRNPAARALGALIISAAALGLAGCSGDKVTEPDDTGGDVVGSWTAISFGGNLVPISEYVQDPDKGTCLRELRGVDLSYTATGTYAWVEEVYLDCSNVTHPETVTNTFTGTYRVEGAKLFMKDSTAELEQEYTFTVAGNELSMRVVYGAVSIRSVFQRS